MHINIDLDNVKHIGTAAARRRLPAYSFWLRPRDRLKKILVV